MSEEVKEDFKYIKGHSKTVQDLIFQGQKIAAIKEIREEKGLTLKDAKQYVEHLADKMSEENENFSVQQRAGCGAVIAISAGVAAFAKMFLES